VDVRNCSAVCAEFNEKSRFDDLESRTEYWAGSDCRFVQWKSEGLVDTDHVLIELKDRDFVPPGLKTKD
jgi:hypothetical protein